MIKSTIFQWLPQPSTVIGLGILAGKNDERLTREQG
jgi:hypothetical protein